MKYIKFLEKRRVKDDKRTHQVNIKVNKKVNNFEKSYHIELMGECEGGY